ncbi:hypothetical protein AB7Z98_16110 [Providencia manganoxydans]|uniref:hypothetical protein n=1 Tax=Providencia manganoxydans TaxID=2923283 RepID=UPI0034E4FAA0
MFDRKKMSDQYNDLLKIARRNHYHYNRTMTTLIRELKSELLSLASKRYISGYENNEDLISYLQVKITQLESDQKSMTNHIKHHGKAFVKFRNGSELIDNFEKPVNEFAISTVNEITDRISVKSMTLLLDAQNKFDVLSESIQNLDLNYSKSGLMDSLNSRVIINDLTIGDYKSEFYEINKYYEQLVKDNGVILKILENELANLDMSNLDESEYENNQELASWVESAIYNINQMHEKADRLFISNKAEFENFLKGNRDFAGPFWHGTYELNIDYPNSILSQLSHDAKDAISRSLAEYNEFNNKVMQLNEKYQRKSLLSTDNLREPSVLIDSIALLKESTEG